MDVIRFIKRIVFVSLALLCALSIMIICVFFLIQPPKIEVPEQKSWVLSNITIWNPGIEILERQTITISAGMIADIKPTTAITPTSLCDGCFAMPGLIDAHVHTPPKLAFGNQALFSLLYLKYGVTTVRDLGQFDDSLSDLVNKLNTGNLVGPRMYRCGRILDGIPVSVPGAIAVKDEVAGRRVVSAHHEQGVDCIKIYGNLSVEAFRGVAAQAQALGLPLIGHTPSAMSFHEIKNFESQHYTGIPYLKNAAPKGWAYKSQDLIDMTSTDMIDVIDVMNKNNIAFLPTNANVFARLTVSAPERFPATEGFKHLPNFWEIAWPSIVSHPETEAEIQTDLDAMPKSFDFVSKAHNEGIDVLVGTDVIMPYVIPGESMHLQLELLSQAFGSDEVALKAATHINGKHIAPGKIGVIAKEAYADLLLFKADPRDDLSKIQNWDFAIVGGRLYSRDDIDDAVDRYDQHFRGKLYTTIMDIAYNALSSDYEESEVAKH